MKRKVFSLMMLCLFAFLGMANAQQGDMSVTPNPIDLGYRPLGAWMRPLKVQFTSTTSTAQTITSIEAENEFFVIDANLPGTVSSANPFNFNVTIGEAEAGLINSTLVAMTSNRKAYLFDISAVAYNPITADVVEMAPSITFPFTATVGENIYDNYLLPGNATDGKDVVYKMLIEDDVLFTANVEGENGKVAVYTDDFNGEPGPGADNSYEGITPGGGGASAYEALIGDENNTTTTNYFPFYTLYNYSISEQLYTAVELVEAGMNNLPMASISFEAMNETGKEQKDISIWMANVSDAELTTTSHTTAGMTLVFTGNITPVTGWNEIVFNQNQFAWDGSSNLLICVQRLNGEWNTSIRWKSHNAGFTAMAYHYRDNAPYNMAGETNTMYTSSSRANTLFKSINPRFANNRDYTLTDITLTPGVYYLAASSTSDVFTVNANIDILPVPEQATNPSPADGQTGISMPAILSWDFGNYTTAYRVVLGTTYPPTNVVVDWTDQLSSSLAVTNLYNNKNYFWRVDEKNSNGITEGQIWGFTTALNVPQNLTAVDEKIYEGDALELSWTNINDRSYRGYNLYQDGVKINNSLITTTEYTVTGLTYNMSEGYTFNVTAVYDEGESDFSNDLVAFVTGNGAISGKVFEVDGVTGIANVDIFIEGTDEFNRPANYALTSGSNGAFNNNILAGTYHAWVSKDGYQPSVYEGDINITYGQVTPNINFVMQENLYPVGEVLAEEMSANQVKVYWSQGIMSELIEDFETGDLSSFNWVNDPVYPWAIVSGGCNSESQYCLKSTNAGVASSTASIEVSVDINRDGLMSFYHKISSESNYDKGYFYIDGTEKMNTSGAGNWQQKEYPITAGVHTFKWAYGKDSSVNSNEDCWYIDNISFIHDAEPVTPAEPGWVYYDNGENEDAIGTGGGQFSWGVMFPAGSYTGNTVTKVMAYDYMAMSGTVTIYNDGVTAPANAVGEMNISFTGAEQFVEFTFSSPVSINPSKNLWVIFYNASGATYPAAVCADMGDPNGRWVSIDGIDWMDLAEAGLNNTFMIRAYVANGKGEPQEITVNHPHTGGTLASSGIAQGHGNRAFNHYNVYRATEGNESEAELITSVTDTVFFDNEIANLAPGIYKWGVSRVYEGNRGNRDVIETQNFESGELGNWTSIDADGDGFEWYVLLNSSTSADIPGHNNSDGHATSASYQSIALNPDNYLVSPQVALGGTLHFYACAQDASWAAEHFGVAVSTTTASASAFTMLQEWTMTSKGTGAATDVTRDGNRTQGNWYEYTVDLSNYAGQTGYVAIRHFNCTDMFRLNIDDIEITGSGEPGPVDPPTPPTPPIVGGNESDIVWSNTIEHGMYVSTNITVTNNAAASPEGAVVTLTNISEPEMNLVYTATLDETGYYVWDNMRRGTYNITIHQEGFESIDETIEIGDVNDLHYVLTEIIAEVGELYVSGTGWAMFGNIPSPVNPDDPTPPSGGWTVDFENGGIPSGWTVLDANNDGYTWTATSAIPSTWTYYASLSLDWYHGGTDAVCSGSYINGVGALNPDEYLITPQVTPSNGSTFSFWAAATDASYAADHFGVAVSTTTPTASAFTTIQEWTLTAKDGGMNGGRASREGKGAKLGSWYNYSVDLSSYAGQSIYIAIRHFNCYDQYIMCVDDVTFTADRGIESYNVKLNGELQGTTTNPFFQHDVEDLVEGETYTTSVQAVYATGASEWVSFDWVYTPCDNFEGLQSADVEWQGENVVLSWVLPEGGDIPTPPDPQPSTVYDFEDGTMQGWTTIDADGDGSTWMLGSVAMGAGYGHNGSSDLVLSKSYDNNYGALYPDNYFVSPQVTLGGEIKFWACAQDNAWAAEHFGVAVSTTTATAGAFTTIQEWTMTAKGAGVPTDVTRDGSRTQGNWYQYTVDLSNYAGQTGYVAIRHFNCTDYFYLDVDDIELGGNGGDTPTPPDPPTPGDVYNFDDGTMQGWTTIDADGDGSTWMLGSVAMGAGYGHNGSADLVLSKSYDNNYGALYPDNYFVSPQIALGGSISFYACAQDNAWAAEHFGVAVSTTTATAGAFTTIQEWTMTAKGAGTPTDVTRDGSRTQGNWYLYTVDLSSYAGQTGYVAIRHFNCTDYFYLDVDDISLGESKGNRDVTYTFDGGTMEGWTTLDADGDGSTWMLGSVAMGAGYGHNGSADLVLSKSYDNNYGALYPDNYFVSPQMTLGGAISFYACAQDNAWAAEHFGVAVSTSTATAGAFTTIQEWTMTAKGAGVPTDVTRDGSRTQGNWYLYTVDLSAYEGQTGYVAIRHFNCTDYFYLDVDDITLGAGGDTPPVPPVDPPTGNIYDFEDGTMQGWTTIDADGDGSNWMLGSVAMGSGYGHNGSSDLVLSKSYDNNYGALYPDNYLVSPQVTLGGEIKFWACAQDNAWAAEHFGVAVSTTTATAGAFTTIQEWTMTAKGAGTPTDVTRDGSRTQGNWYQYTVDLSAYAGQTGYVAIRHFNCTDYFYLDVDDIELGGSGDDPNPPVPPTPGANVLGVEIFREGEWIAEVPATTTTYTDIAPGEVEYYEIRVVYSGNTEDYTHYTMSCPEILVPAEVVCVEPENLEGEYIYYDQDNFGAQITWTYPEAVEGTWYQYDDGNYATSVGAGSAFKWAVMFPAGSHQGGIVTKVTLWDVYSPMVGTVSIYTGTANEPQNQLVSADIEFDGNQEEFDVIFNEMAFVNANDNVWVVVDNTNSTAYPAAASNDVTNDPNGRWVYLEGNGWLDLASAGLPGYSWLMHCYISDTFFFEVFRNGTLIADVPYSDGGLQMYYDQVGIGNYQYQVIAVTDDCESDFALTPDGSHDYVEVNVTNVTENIETRIYPNPTTGIVNIEANGMNHITVVNALGQIVFDTNISGDQYQMNLGQFKAGVYMVRISTEEGVSVKRVTVAK